MLCRKIDPGEKQVDVSFHLQRVCGSKDECVRPLLLNSQTTSVLQMF